MTDHQNLYHPNEEQRIESLHDLQILDTPIEQRFEHITGLLRKVFDVPISALSFVDLHRQWFKSMQGQRVEQTRRCISFCQHTILQDEVMVIPDARFDDRFATSPLVTEDKGVVFYAGAPVHGPDGLPVASLCILDREPRSLDDRDKQILTQFARLTETLLNSPRASEVEDTLVHEAGESWRSTLVDPLTRIWNADGIKTLIQETITRSKMTNDRIGITMIEIADYDQIVKEQGPAAADELAIEFSRKALEAMKPHDSLGHLRKGEFCALNIKLRDRDMLMDRLGIMQMVADELNHGIKIGAQMCSMFLNPRSSTNAQTAMQLVEEKLAAMSKDEWFPPEIIDDPDGHNQSCAA